MSIRKRILLAIIAVALIRMVFYSAPRVIATRPRFPDEAWREAREILAEEVGQQAVRSGIFTIPRVAVSSPYRGRAVAIDRSPARPLNAFLVASGGDGVLVVSGAVGPDSGAAHGGRCRVARLGPAEAGHIFAVMTYLGAVDVGGEVSPEAGERQGGAAFEIVDESWRPLRGPERSPLCTGATLSSALGRNCLRRHLGRLAESREIAFTEGAEAVVPALLEVLGSALPPTGGADSLVIDHCVRLLRPYADRRALPLLRRISRLNDRGAAGGVLGRLFRTAPRSHRLGDVRGDIWVIENAAARDEAGQIVVASKAAFDLLLPTDTREAVRLYLEQRWPGEWGRLILENFSSLDESAKIRYLGEYRRHFGSDPRAAELAAAGSSALAAVRGSCELCRLTGDAGAVERLWKTAFPETAGLEGPMGRVLRPAVKEAQACLKALYLEGAGVGDVPGAFRAYDGPVDIDTLISLLAEAGGKENRQYLLRLAQNPRKAVTLDGRYSDASHIRDTAWAAVAASREAYAADSLAAHLAAGKPPTFEDLAQMVAGVVEASGPDTLLHMEALLSGRPAVEDSAAPGEDWARAADLARAGVVERLLLAHRLEEAAEPVEYYRALDAGRRGLVREKLAGALARRWDEGELEALLADRDFNDITGFLYAALVLRREKDVIPADSPR